MSVAEAVRCPTCRATHHADADAVTFPCPQCDNDWVWAICEACDSIELALSSEEAWRCGSCSRYTRSWWRTAAADNGAAIRQRRHTDRVKGVTARLAPRRRKRRLVLASTVLAIAVVGVVSFVIGQVDGRGGVAERTRLACLHFDDLRSDVANGALDPAGLAQELASIRSIATQADPGVATAARSLVAPAEPNSAAFLVAQTKFANACRLAANT